MKLKAALVCSVGCMRTNNEDNFFFDGYVMPRKEMDRGDHLVANMRRRRTAFAVFDGMGGGERGEYASYMSAQLLGEWMKGLSRKSNIPKLLPQYALDATRRIYTDALGAKAEMQGSTLALLLFDCRMAYIGNIGDSRVYIRRSGRVKQITFDHSAAGKLQRQGLMTYEEVRNAPHSNVIHQYLGMHPKAVPQEFISQYQLPVCRNDRFLLCSDGLSDLLPLKLLESAMINAETADALACQLTSASLELSGKDNVTCIVVDVCDTRLPEPDMNDPLFASEKDIPAEKTDTN